jgi:hypothetical protein
MTRARNVSHHRPGTISSLPKRKLGRTRLSQSKSYQTATARVTNPIQVCPGLWPASKGRLPSILRAVHGMGMTAFGATLAVRSSSIEWAVMPLCRPSCSPQQSARSDGKPAFRSMPQVTRTCQFRKLATSRYYQLDVVIEPRTRFAITTLALPPQSVAPLVFLFAAYLAADGGGVLLRADRDSPDEETAVRRAKEQHFANGMPPACWHCSPETGVGKPS